MIRGARPEDASKVEALLRSYGLFAELTPSLAGFVVAEANGELLGCAAAESYGAQTLLRSVATAPTARSGGLGARLAEEALALASARGASEAWLLTEGSEAFFAKRGFVRVERAEAPEWLQAHAQWRLQCPSSALVMRRKPASPERLFVYGTLRSGSPVAAARRLHAEAASLGVAWARGRRVELGTYPGLVDRGEGEIAGESFLLPPDPAARLRLFEALDEYEGVGPEDESCLPFRREVRWVRDADGSSAPHWLYFWRGVES